MAESTGSHEIKLARCGCGGEAEVTFESSSLYYTVHCKKCETETYLYDSEAEAVTAWNRAMGREEPKWWCNLCACYDKQRCYCNLHGIWVASDFGCKAFEPYCDEEDTDWSGNE